MRERPFMLCFHLGVSAFMCKYPQMQMPSFECICICVYLHTKAFKKVDREGLQKEKTDGYVFIPRQQLQL